MTGSRIGPAVEVDLASTNSTSMGRRSDWLKPRSGAVVAMRAHMRTIAPRVLSVAMLGSLLALHATRPNQTAAQATRFELGQRVRAMEEAWERNKDAERRRFAVVSVNQAVMKFFSFQQVAAARLLDEARFALCDPPADKSSDERRRWAESLAFEPSSRLLDAATAQELKVKSFAFYSTNTPIPADAKLELSLSTADGRQLACAETPIAALPAGTVFQLSRPSPPDQQSQKNWPTPPGDCSLTATVVFGDQRILLPPQTVSFVAERDTRLAKLRALVAPAPAPMPASGETNEPSAKPTTAPPTEQRAELRAEPTTAGESLREQLRILDALAAGQTLETNFPAARMLADAELLADELRRATKLVARPTADGTKPAAAPLADARNADESRAVAVGAKQPGELWRVFIGPKQQRCTVRLLAPPTETPDASRPLVVALHGSGGSENMFFDAYGAGKIVKLCRERDWLLVAPRQGLLGGVGMTLDELTDEVERLHPVDRRRVFVIGHSMGAMQALRMVDQAKAKPALVAALGGGGRVSRPTDLQSTRFVIGVGALDMGRRGGMQLADQLRRASLPHVELHDYADTDHLTVVQVGLDDVFRTCDAVARE